MRAVLAAHGVTPDRAIVVYCTIGNRASQAWFALTQLLDYPGRGRLLRLLGGVGHPCRHARSRPNDRGSKIGTEAVEPR